MRKRLWLWVAGLAGALALVTLTFFPSWRGHASAEEPAPSGEPSAVAVTVAEAALHRVERSVEVVGTIEGFEEINISPKVEGRILRINHDVGDEVAPGACLAEIDDTDYRLAVAEAQRGVELELARLGLKELPANDKIEMTKVPSVARAITVEENARQSLDRARRLGRVMSVEDQERANMEHRVATALRDHAELEARATLASARLKLAQLQTAKQKLIDACVGVPSPSPRRLPPGVTDPSKVRFVVASRKVAEGEVVRVFPSPVLFRLVIDQPLKLVVTVPERFYSEIRTGQTVELAAESYPGAKFTAAVSRINPTVDRGNRTFTVEVLVPNQDRKLRPGSFVKARIITRQNDQALAVPEEAVVRFAGVVKVFVVQNDRAQPVVVQTGEVVTETAAGRKYRWIEVSGGLKPGDAVVVSGQSQLAKDTVVRVRK